MLCLRASAAIRPAPCRIRPLPPHPATGGPYGVDAPTGDGGGGSGRCCRGRRGGVSAGVLLVVVGQVAVGMVGGEQRLVQEPAHVYVGRGVLGVAGHEGSTVIVGLNGLRLLATPAWRRAAASNAAVEQPPPPPPG